MDDPAVLLEDHAPESYLVIEPFDLIEHVGQEATLAVVNELRDLMQSTDSTAILHCMENGVDRSDSRQLTLKRVDQVWRLQVMVFNEDIMNRLVINKARHGRSLSKPVDLILTEGVRIDTSRNI